jgi:hypothetical protein
MVIDGTYLAIFKPMVNVGGEIIASDVIVPGAVTTLSDPNADLRAINVGSDLKSGLEMLSVVENSINESSQEPLQNGQDQNGTQTAFEISKIEQNANTVLGLFLQMIAKHVRDFGKLRLGDILQYLTLPEVADITGSPEMTYKTFFLKGNSDRGGKNKKIAFDKSVPDTMTKDSYLNASYDLLQQEEDKKMELARVNPVLLRNLKYMVTISSDILNPRSEDLERAYALEDFDRMIIQPTVFDPEETGKLLLMNNPITKKDPDKYVAKQPQSGSMQPPQMGPDGKPIAPTGTMPQAGNGPLNAMNKKSPIAGGGKTPVASLAG